MTEFIALYTVIGVVFGCAFVLWGYAALQPDAKGSIIRFRLLLFPACLLLWPWLGYRWVRSL